jgi:hypothetical protein
MPNDIPNIDHETKPCPLCTGKLFLKQTHVHTRGTTLVFKCTTCEVEIPVVVPNPAPPA